MEQQSGAQDDDEEHKDEEHRREMAKRREQEKEAHANLIDYREVRFNSIQFQFNFNLILIRFNRHICDQWTVSMSALCMKADTE